MTATAILAADPISGEISTFGWDTAFAVRLDNVNAAIAARKASPAGFAWTDPEDDQVFCRGSFGDWAVVRGGDGGGVNVALPLVNVSGQMGAAHTPYSCAKATITVTVALRMIEVDPKTRHLVVDPTGAAIGGSSVQLYGVDFSQAPVTPPGAVYALQGAVLSWCAANLADFAYVFSIVDLGEEAGTGAWSFLQPTSVSYAYVDGPDDADAFLGVLAMTGGASGGKNQQTLDARIVQSGEEGAFCISRDLLLSRLILPNLQVLWPQLQAGQVTLSETGIDLNPNEQVALPVVTYQGSEYTPKLAEFTLTIEGEQVSIDAYTLTDVQDGVTAWCRTTAHYTIRKGTNNKGETTLAYVPLGDPTTSHGHYIAEWVEITDAILAFVLAIALAALAVLTGGVAAVVIGVVGALIVGVVALTPQIQGLIEDGDAPAIDLLAENVYAPIVWTDSADFTIDSVQLSGALRLGGSLGFGTATGVTA